MDDHERMIQKAAIRRKLAALAHQVELEDAPVRTYAKGACATETNPHRKCNRTYSRFNPYRV